MGMSYGPLLKKRLSYTIFVSPETFLDACAEYFDWCVDNPLQEEEVYQYKGAIVRADKNKVRAFTKKGLCTHIGIPENRLVTYRNQGGLWAEAVELVEQVIYTQKFENAAAGLLNAGIITRDLGLADKQEVSGPDGGPVVTITSEMTEAEAAEYYAATLQGNQG